jgi:MFS family permease
MVNGAPGVTVSSNTKLFWGSFIALVATAFAFMLRVQLMGTWEQEFALTKTQAGTIFGAGFWPFGVSIVLFSMVLDRVGYRKAMVFAFCCHVLFAVMTIFADGYWMLYWGSVIGALAAGTVEAVINPLIATIYKENKTTWLNILHAGWPGGLVVTGIVVIFMSGSVPWEYQIGLILVPTAIYGFMMLTSHFPVSERVAAGVSYREMLAEMGWGGAFIVSLMIVMELTANVLGIQGLRNIYIQVVIAGVFAAVFGSYTRSFGRPVFVFLLVVMLLLATTELGTDSWVKDLLGPSMKSAFSSIDDPSRWVLVYTAAIMMVLRFVCGPIIERLKPLGVLAASALTVAVGIYWLAELGLDPSAGAIVIIIACTVYGVGQTFFWPTTLGLVSESFPRGGAITLNVIAGVGMLGVGVLGNPWLGNVQDSEVTSALMEKGTELHAKFVTEPRQSLFGEYVAIDVGKKANATVAELEQINAAEVEGKMAALKVVVILPLLMLVSYLGLMAYFKSKGGYKPILLQPSE